MKREAWPDVVRVVALVGVLLAHSIDAGMLRSMPGEPWHLWWATNALYCLSRVAVPMFVMTSGALLLDPRKAAEPLRVFFRKRLVKVLLPLLAWRLAYLWALGGDGPLWRRFLTEGPHFHLWFGWMILGLYALTPILRRWMVTARRQDMVYLLAVWALAVPVGQYLGRYTVEPACLRMLGYFVGGRVLSTVSVRRRWPLVGLIVLLTVWLMASREMTAAGVLAGEPWGYVTPWVVLQAGAAFLLLRSVRWPGAWVRMAGPLAVSSWGVYLVHDFTRRALMHGTFGVRLWWDTVHPLVTGPATALAVLAFSLAVVAVLRATRLTRWAVP